MLKYWIAINPVFTHQDRADFTLEGFAENIWRTSDNAAANAWAARINATATTQAAAQALLDALPLISLPNGQTPTRIVL